MANLGTVVTEWRRINDEISQHRQQASEKTKRAKVLEGLIMNIMKQQKKFIEMLIKLISVIWIMLVICYYRALNPQ